MGRKPPKSGPRAPAAGRDERIELAHRWAERADIAMLLDAHRAGSDVAMRGLLLALEHRLWVVTRADHLTGPAWLALYAAIERLRDKHPPDAGEYVTASIRRVIPAGWAVARGDCKDDDPTIRANRSTNHYRREREELRKLLDPQAPAIKPYPDLPRMVNPERAGEQGYAYEFQPMTKSIREIVIENGGTDAEADVAELRANGLSLAMIAASLGLTRYRVEVMLDAIRTKLSPEYPSYATEAA